MGLNKEDKQFLKELQHQMLTQDTVGQASPRFWVVRHKVRQYGIEDGYAVDGVEVVHNCEMLAENLKELYEYLRDTKDDLKIKYNNDIVEEYVVIGENTDEEQYFYDIRELVDYMIDELEYDNSLYMVNYKDEYVIAEDTMFITLEECRKHIECNGHHYNEPHPYAMTAWRSPQVKRLYEILENTNWDN